jgi:hypothetical protein
MGGDDTVFFTTRGGEKWHILWLLFVFILIYNTHGEILAHLADLFTNIVAIGNSCFGLFFFDIRILITSLISSNFSYRGPSIDASYQFWLIWLRGF